MVLVDEDKVADLRSAVLPVEHAFNNRAHEGGVKVLFPKVLYSLILCDKG